MLRQLPIEETEASCGDRGLLRKQRPHAETEASCEDSGLFRKQRLEAACLDSGLLRKQRPLEETAARFATAKRHSETEPSAASRLSALVAAHLAFVAALAAARLRLSARRICFIAAPTRQTPRAAAAAAIGCSMLCCSSSISSALRPSNAPDARSSWRKRLTLPKSMARVSRGIFAVCCRCCSGLIDRGDDDIILLILR